MALVLFVPSSAFALGGIQVAPGDSTVAAVSPHQIRFNTSRNIGVGGSIHIIYPDGFDLSGVTLQGWSGFGGASLSLSVSAQTVVVEIGGTAVAAGDKVLDLSGVGQPTQAASYVDTLTTRRANGKVLEGPEQSAPFELVAGPPEHLHLETAASSFVAGEFLSMRVIVIDAYGNPAPSGEDRPLDLLSDSPGGSYHLATTDPAIDTVTLAADSSGIDLYYRDTMVQESPITLTVLDGSSPSLGFDQATVDLLAAAVDAAHSTVGATSPVTADGVAVSTVSVVLLDAFDNPVAGVDSARIAFTLDAPSYGVNKSESVSAPDGAFGAELRTLWAGEWTVQVSVDGTVLDTRPTVVFDPRPIDPVQSHLTASASAVADGVDAIALDLELMDAAGRAVSGVDSSAVVFEVLDGVAVVDELDSLSATDGSFSARLRSTVAGGRRVTAVVDGVALADTVIVQFVAGAVDALHSTVTAGGPAVADGVDSLRLDIVLRDGFDNPVAGVDSAAIEVFLADAAVDKAAAASASDGSFLAFLRSTRAGGRLVTVTAAGVALADTVQAVFETAGVDSASSSLTATGAAVADGVEVVSLTLTLLDAWSNPVAGIDSSRISLDLPHPWQVEKLDGASDAAGVFHLGLRSTLSSSGWVTARVDGSAVATPVWAEFVAGPLDHYQLVLPDGPSTVAGVSARLVLEARDLLDNRIVQHLGTVTVSAATGGDGSNLGWTSLGQGTLTPSGASAVDYAFAAGDSGQVTLEISDTRAESLVLQATEGSAAGSVELEVQAAAAARLVMLDGDGQSAVVATQLPQTLMARVTDAWDNPVAGEPVDFLAADGGRSDVDPSTPGDQTTAVSAADGLVSCPVWELGPVAGVQHLAAQAAFGGRVDYSATALAGPAAGLTLEPNGDQQLSVSSSAVVAARAVDAYGNAVAGLEVTIFVTDAIDGILSGVGETDSLGLSQQRGHTGADGRVSVLYSSPSTAGAVDVLDATASGIAAGAVDDLVFTAVEGSASAIVLTLPADATRAGVEGSLQVQLVDEWGNPASSASATVRLAADASSGMGFSASSGGPYASSLDLPVLGSRSVYFRGTLEGVHTVSAEDTASVLSSASGQVEIVASDQVAAYDLSYPPIAAAGTTFTLRADAYDAFGNPAIDAAEDFILSLVDAADSNLGVPVPLQVDAGSLGDGFFETTLERVDVAGSYRVRLDSPSGRWFGPSLQIDPAAAWQLTAVGADSLSGVTAGEAVDFTVEVLDSFGNPVPAENLNVVTLEGGTLLLRPDTTDAGGRALFRLRTDAQVGQARLRVGIDDNDPIDLETALLVVDTVAGSIASLQLTPSALLVQAGESLSFVVEAFDAAGNRVESATDLVDFTATSAAVAITPPSANLSGGEVAAAAVDTLVEQFQVHAALNADPSIAVDSELISVHAAGAWRVIAVGDTLLSAPSGSRQPLQLRVEDRFANAVAGVVVRLSLLEAPEGASLEDPDSPVNDGLALTDAQGEVSFDLLLSALSGTHRVEAAILDGSPASLERAKWTVEGLAGAADHVILHLAQDDLVAGQAAELGVRVEDTVGNLVETDGEMVLSAPGFSFSTDPETILLSEGTATVSLSVFTAGVATFDAALAEHPEVTGSLDSVVVAPAEAAGVIAIEQIDPPENTANGLAVTRIVTAPIRDAWDNVVREGSRVDVSADGGAIVSDDLDPFRPGVQRSTDALGQVELRLAAPLTPGPVNIDFTSAAATGRAVATFAAPAELSADGSLSPSSAVPGADLTFTLDVHNGGGVDALLDPAQCSLRIVDGTGRVVTALLAAAQTVPAASTVTLSFAAVTLPADFAPGSLAPTVSLAGVDVHGQPVMAFLPLPEGSLVVASLVVRSVTHPSQAVVGDTVSVAVKVENLGAGVIDLSQLALRTSPLADFVQIDQDALPSLAAGAQADVSTRLLVGSATAVGSYRFVARVTGSVGGIPFTAPEDSSLTPLVVQSASDVQIVDGGVTPPIIHRGAELALELRVRNDGGAVVELDASACVARLSGSSWQAPMSGPVALAPQEETLLRFDPVVVDTSVPTGSHDLLLHLEGEEGLSSVVIDLVAAGAVLVQTPVQLSLDVVPLDPAAVLRGSTVSFRLKLHNAGEATLDLDPLATALTLGEPGGGRLRAGLDPQGTLEIAPGETIVNFLSLDLPADLLLGDPVGVAQIRGLENGLPFEADLSLPPGSLRVEDPAGLRILSTEALNPRAPAAEVNAGQTIPLRVVVGNAGGDGVDSLLVRLSGTATPPSTAPDRFVAHLAGGAVDTLLFEVQVSSSIGPEVLRAQIVRAVSPITGETVTPETPLDDLASLVVQRPVALAFDAGFPAGDDPHGLSVSPGQVFSVQARLEADPSVDGQGEWLGVDVTLDGLGGFTPVDPGALPLHLDPAHPVSSLELRAPLAAENTELVVALARVDLDANDPQAHPLTTPSSVTLHLEVNGGVAFERCELALTAPQGALDHILSTGQSFTVRGTLTGPDNLQERVVELLVPSSLALVGGAARQAIAPGDSTVSWQLQCPVLPAFGLQLSMAAVANDVQSGEAVADTSSALVLEVVEAARAVARLEVTAPVSAAQRGELPPNAEVEFQGGFDLLGDASARGPAQLRLELPEGFTLIDDSEAVVTLDDPAELVHWRARGPARVDLGVQTIVLRTETAPIDENSEEPASGSDVTASVSLTILADPLKVQVADLDSVGSLVGSDRFYPKATLTVRNGLDHAVQLERIELTVVDDAGRPVDEPSRFLQAVELSGEGAAGDHEATVEANPVVIEIGSVLESDGELRLVLGVRAHEQAPYASFAFALDGRSVVLTESSAVPLNYQLLDGEGQSRSQVVVAAGVTSPTTQELSAHSYPNPFVPSREQATLAYALRDDAPVRIEIFDMLGKRVREWNFPVGTDQSRAGVHDGDVRWDGRNGRGQTVRNGVYLCRLRAGGHEVIYRIAVTR